MIPYKVARIISVAMVVGAVLFSVYVLSGCVSQEEVRKGNKEMMIIAYEFREFAYECESLGGKLHIERPLSKRRVHNAPITVWEMKDAVCFYENEVYPVRLYYK